MGTKTFNNYEDLLTFTRASKGHALRPVSYGTELVANGTFDTDASGWNALGNSTISVSNGEMIVSGDGGYNDYAQDLITTEAGKLYSVEATGRSITGNMFLAIKLSVSPFTTLVSHTFTSASPETVKLSFVAGGPTTQVQFIQYSGSAGSGALDNVSVKEVTFDQPDGTLTLFEHPNNIPRVEWDADRNRLGLLVEEARTNLFTNSNAIDSTLTSLQNLTVSNEEVSTGVYQGTWRKFTEDTSTAQHRLVGSNVVTISAGSYATISCLVKRISGTRNVQMMIYSGGDNFVGSFDLDAETGSVSKGGTGTAGTATVENLGNGIYRISANGIVSTTVTNCSVIWRLADGATNSYTGDGTSSVAVTAMQIEVGAFRTSLIKTTGSSATRSADVASIPAADFGYNQSAGSLLAEAKLLIKDVSYKAVVNLNTDGSNRIRIISSSSVDVIQAEITDGGANQLSLSESITEGASFKAIIAYKENNSSSSVNGSVEAIDTACTIPAVTKLDIMTGMTGHIKSIKYYPRRLTNAQLQELTS